MSIATEIQRLQQAKADIKTAIENKGVTVGDGTIDTFAAKISEITGSGGGIPAGYKTVTFKNGDNVLFERLVLSGDDCPDPLTQGRIETPTKESTVQYHYTYSGWTSVDGGTADGSILKNITEDKVVYSAYSATAVKYTITYYDEDGVTVLHTEQLGYGSVPNYMPTKDGFAFDKWTPTPVKVTGNASYTVSWVSVLDSGTCGDSTMWALSTDYALTISGTGAMYDYKYNTMPWYSYQNQIISVNVLDGVTSIGNNAFYEHKNIASVDIADSVTSIGTYAFYYCTGITSLNLGNGVTSISERAFYRCEALTSITIPDSVTNIGNNAFSYCSKLTSVYISSLEAWCNIDYTSQTSHPLYDRAQGNLYINGTPATNITIPNSVTSIKPYTFYNCKNITSVTIPNGVTSIGGSAFEYCSNVTSITIPDSVTNIGDRAFSGCTNLASATIGNSVTSIGQYAFGSCTTLTSITIPDSVTTIVYAFFNCKALVEVIFIDPVGWSAGDVALNSSDLSNPATARTYLVETYLYKIWTKS